jgi:hypothetical protein
MNGDVIERRREIIREAREAHATCSYRQRLESLKRGGFDSEDEALEGLERGPFAVSDEDVLHSFAQDLDTVQAMRRHADELERRARSGLGLEGA